MSHARSLSPTLSRRRLLAGIAGGAALATLPLGGALAAQDPTAVLFNRINDYRAANGKPRLPMDHQLTAVAQAWSARMAARSSMSHNPNGREEYGWQADMFGENVASIGSGTSDPADKASRAVDAWINSSGHRRTMLGDWTDLGVGWGVASNGRLYATSNFIRTDLPGAGQEAISQSQAMIADQSAGRVVIVRDDVAADALAASGLIDGNTPLLLTRANQPLPATLHAELRRVVASGATVYLIGGALHSGIDGQVREAGAMPHRITGQSRYETAAAVAREVIAVRGRPNRFFLANGEGWADAVAAGAFAARFGTPVLLTQRDGLHPAARSVLDSVGEADRVVVGGTGALADRVAEQAGAWRLTGQDRADTGGRVMLDVWAVAATPNRPLVVSPGWTGDGWATALATSTFSARHEAPLLFSGTGLPGPVATALGQAGFGHDTPASLRFVHNVSGQAREEFLAAAT